MYVNDEELKKMMDRIEKNPAIGDDVLIDLKLIHSIYSGDDGIPPRFGKNFREEGPVWEKVKGLEFESMGRILVCHLSIEHYILKLIELSSPKEFSWDDSRMTFSQKLKLVGKIKKLKDYGIIEGIEILNKIRNQLSHDLLAKINPKAIDQITQILFTIRTRDKTEEQVREVKRQLDLYDSHAIIEAFTSQVCAYIAGYCTSLVENTNKK